MTDTYRVAMEDGEMAVPSKQRLAMLDAEERGKQAGQAAGSWVVDGNTTTETARRLLKGIEQGDPEILDMMPAPLSGEWAGESIMELLGDLLEDVPADEQGELLDTYELGYSQGYWDEVERAARYILGHDVFGHPHDDSSEGGYVTMGAMFVLVVLIALASVLAGYARDVLGDMGAEMDARSTATSDTYKMEG